MGAPGTAFSQYQQQNGGMGQATTTPEGQMVVPDDAMYTKGLVPSAYNWADLLTQMFNLPDLMAEAEVLHSRDGVTTKNPPARQLEGRGYISRAMQPQTNIVNAVRRQMPVGSTTRPDIKTLRGSLAGLYELTPEQLNIFTNKLYKAGFYSDSFYSKDKTPDPNLVDPETLYAAQQAFVLTAQYRGKKTLQEVLNERAEGGALDQKIKDAKGEKVGSLNSYSISDPAGLREATQKIATTLLGRALSDDERDLLVNKITASERSQGQQGNAASASAREGADISLEQIRIDAEARLNEEIKARNPAEATATSYANNYSVLEDMIRGLG